MKNRLHIINKTQVIVLAVVLGLVIVAAGFIYYKYEARDIRNSKYKELKAITDLKESQIKNWIKERKADAIVISQSPFFVEGIEDWLGNKNNLQLKQQIIQRLIPVNNEFGYEDIFLTSNKGELLFSVINNLKGFDQFTKVKILEAVNNQEVILSDLYLGLIDNKIHYDIVAPLISKNNNVIGALVFRRDPAQFLYPFIQSWPTPSKSAETLLLRVEKDSVLILNDLRDMKNSALKLKISLSRTEVPAVQAALGHTGMFEGKDYRGVRVLSDIKIIPEHNWIILAKVDESEIYSSLYITAGVIMGFSFLLIVICGLAIASIYNSQQKDVFRELYKREKELWQHQERFKVTLDSLGDGVITLDLKGKVQYMNKIAENLTGWKLREASGRLLSEVYSVKNEETGEKENNILEKVIKLGIVKELANHTILISKNGKEIPVMDTGAPVYDNDGSLISIVIAFQDETEKRNHQKIIKESEHRLRATLDTMLEGCQIIDRNWHYTYVNDSAAKHGRTTRESLLGRSMIEVYPGIENSEMFSALQKCMDKGIAHSMDNEFIFPDGTKGWFELIIQPCPDGVFIVSQDITERKLAEEELIKAKLKAEENDSLKTAFLHNISHEIRTPLNAIVGFSALMNEPAIDSSTRQFYTQEIINGSDQLLSIITDIIDISNIEANTIKVKKSETNLNSIIRSLYEQFLLKAKNKEITLISEQGLADNDSIILTDKTKVIQIISNLLNNALKFTLQGEIKFGYVLKSNLVEFFISDTGIGIAEEHKKRIFERFYQIENSIGKLNEGTGVGLSICRAYVELLGGEIWLTSKQGEGSTFYFTIPFEKPENTLITSVSKIKQAGFVFPEKKKILVAEDVDSNFKLIELFFSTANAEIIRAFNGKEAVEKCLSNQFIDFVLMDIRMPIMDGYTATELIRLSKPDIPIIAQTAYADDRERAIRSGCSDIISKPFDKKRLFEVISKFV